MVLALIAAHAATRLALSEAPTAPGNQKSPPAIDPSVTAPVRAMSRAFEAAAARVMPAVVSVYSEKTVKMGGEGFPFGDFFRQFFGREFSPDHGSNPQGHENQVPQHGMGSGMILDAQGHILTNYHVVKDVNEIKVKLADQREFEAETVGADPRSDVAVIRIKGKVPDGLPTVTLGSSAALKVGDWVLTVGAPFGLTQTVTAGIIGATSRSDVGIADYEDFLQTDAAINPGNSGGPLLNIEGEVVGMNTAIATSLGQFAGVGFAIPSDMIKSYLPTLVKGGTISRGFLGVAVQDLSDALAKAFHAPDANGALVAEVNPRTPAEAAGIKSGDIIVRYQGKPIHDARDLRQQVAATPPGTNADLTVIRNGKPLPVVVNVGTLPVQPSASGTPETSEPGALGRFGLTVEPLSPDIAKEFGYENQHGVIVSNVEIGSPAALANLQVGDLIVEADRQPVNSVDDLRSALAKSKDSVLLLVKRKNATLYVSMRTKTQ